MSKKYDSLQIYFARGTEEEKVLNSLKELQKRTVGMTLSGMIKNILSEYLKGLESKEEIKINMENIRTTDNLDNDTKNKLKTIEDVTSTLESFEK